MSRMDKLLGRPDYRAMFEAASRENFSLNTENKDLATKLEETSAEYDGEINRLRIAIDSHKNEPLLMPSSQLRSRLFKQALENQKDFKNINGIDIYLANRHSTIYEMVSRISINDSKFENCFFDRACFDNVTFKNSQFANVSFQSAYFEDTEFRNCIFNNCQFDRTKGNGLTFTDCVQNSTSLENIEYVGWQLDAMSGKETSYKHTDFEDDGIDEEMDDYEP